MREPVMDWVREVLSTGIADPPVVEAGSLDVNGTVRPLFPEPYVGIDIRAGPGVDLVADIMDPALRWPLVERPKTAVMVETLEHVRWPHAALAGLWRLLQPGGLIIVTTVFDFPIHGYPNDYWRFTPAGLQILLEDAGFIAASASREAGAGSDWDPVGVFGTALKGSFPGE